MNTIISTTPAVTETDAEKKPDSSPKEHRIGELLIRAKLLQPELLRKAMDVANDSGLQTGKALVRLNVVAQKDVESAAQVQTLIRDGKITSEQGIKALRRSATGGMPLIDVITEGF